METKVGDVLYCHTDLVMDSNGKIEATKGKKYYCEIDNCFTDNSGVKRHVIGSKGDLWFTKLKPGQSKPKKENLKFLKKLFKELKIT